MNSSKKTAYICGPLTELSPEEQPRVKRFYKRIADLYGEVAEVRAFVPHEHYDPIEHAHFSPPQVDKAERRQVKELTSVLVVVASFLPSWGGGIEVEMANEAGVPVVVIHPKDKKVSRLLRGNPAVIQVLRYYSEDQVLLLLRTVFENLLAPTA